MSKLIHQVATSISENVFCTCGKSFKVSIYSGKIGDDRELKNHIKKANLGINA